MFGNRPKKLCRIRPAVSSIAGRSPQYMHPLEGVEVAEACLGVLGPVGAVLLVVGAAEVHGEAHARLVDA